MAPLADGAVVRTLSNHSVTGATVDAVADAVTNRTVWGSVLVTSIGRTAERDTAAGGRLPRDAGGCRDSCGVRRRGDPTLRALDPRVHAGSVLDDAFGDVGNAEGHREMAGGEMPLGIFADDTTDDTGFLDIVEQVVTARLVAELNLVERNGDD